MTYTDALMSGFLTGLLVVVAPVAAWLVFRERLGTTTWIGVALAGVGVAVLGFHASGFGPGELLTLASATVWGLHLVLMSRWSQTEHAWGMARIQTGAVAVLAGLVLVFRSAITGASPLPELPADAETWISVGFLALVATAAAMVLLSWAQSRVAAARAAVILTLEPAVSGLTATLTGSALTGRVILGAILLVAATSVVELARRQQSIQVGRNTHMITQRQGSLVTLVAALDDGQPGNSPVRYAFRALPDRGQKAGDHPGGLHQNPNGEPPAAIPTGGSGPAQSRPDRRPSRGTVTMTEGDSGGRLSSWEPLRILIPTRLHVVPNGIGPRGTDGGRFRTGRVATSPLDCESQFWCAIDRLLIGGCQPGRGLRRVKQ